MSLNELIYLYWKVDFLILVTHLDVPKLIIQNDFPMSVNQLIYIYQTIDLPISVIRLDFLISVNQSISEIRFTDIGNSV